MVLFPDCRSIALIISASAFHLSRKFLVQVTVIDVLLFGDLVQSIDARISSLKSFCQMRARSHVLIAGPVKFDAGLVQRLLKVETPFALTFGASAGLRALVRVRVRVILELSFGRVIPIFPTFLKLFAFFLLGLGVFLALAFETVTAFFVYCVTQRFEHAFGFLR